MNKPIGLRVIGAGAIAEKYMEAFERLGGVFPRWEVSDGEDAAHNIARRWKFAMAGTSMEPALADPLVEVVLIAAPSPLNSGQAVSAMLAGKDVLVEISNVRRIQYWRVALGG